MGGFIGLAGMRLTGLPASITLFCSGRRSRVLRSRGLISRGSCFLAISIFMRIFSRCSVLPVRGGGGVSSKAGLHCTQRAVKRLNSAARSQRCSWQYDKDCCVGESIFKSQKVRCPQRMVPHPRCEISVVFEVPFEVRDATFPCSYRFRFVAACI